MGVETQYITVGPTHIDEEAIARAGKILRGGGLVAFPTETVYGLGGDAFNPASSRKIYAAKDRPSDNPLIVHICRMEDLYRVADPVPEAALRLAAAFWPGPLTMILHKAALVPAETTGGLDTVAVRFPSHPVAQALISAAGGFIAAPSANRSGRPSPTMARYVREDMDGRIEMILDGGEVGIGLESTIVDLSDERPVILRPGYVTDRMLREVLGAVETDRTILEGDCGLRPKAPGMRYRHYAPRGTMTILEGEPTAVAAEVNKRSVQAVMQGEKVGVIATEETKDLYRADSVKSMGAKGDEEAAGRNLYRILREFDDEQVSIIFSESFGREGFGQAIMNRLLKAAGHRIERIEGMQKPPSAVE